jgi:hypothetical protein
MRMMWNSVSLAFRAAGRRGKRKEMLRKISLRISIADDMYYSFGENAEAYSSVGLSAMRCGRDTRSLAHYLGHRSLQSTARYTELAEGRFAKFWRD